MRYVVSESVDGDLNYRRIIATGETLRDISTAVLQLELNRHPAEEREEVTWEPKATRPGAEPQHYCRVCKAGFHAFHLIYDRVPSHFPPNSEAYCTGSNQPPRGKDDDVLDAIGAAVGADPCESPTEPLIVSPNGE